MASWPAALVQAGLSGGGGRAGTRRRANARARGLDPVVCAALDDAGFRPGALPAAGLFDVLDTSTTSPGRARTAADAARWPGAAGST